MVKFWKDRWYNNDSLEEAFPKLFSMVPAKDVQLTNLWE